MYTLTDLSSDMDRCFMRSSDAREFGFIFQILLFYSHPYPYPSPLVQIPDGLLCSLHNIDISFGSCHMQSSGACLGVDVVLNVVVL